MLKFNSSENKKKKNTENIFILVLFLFFIAQEIEAQVKFGLLNQCSKLRIWFWFFFSSSSSVENQIGIEHSFTQQTFPLRHIIVILVILKSFFFFIKEKKICENRRRQQQRQLINKIFNWQTYEQNTFAIQKRRSFILRSKKKTNCK